jgi:uncharacterized membrane protein
VIGRGRCLRHHLDVDDAVEPLSGDELDELERGVYPRGTDEFSRVLTFSDGVFAIAMTLLVAGIEVPRHPDDLSATLLDESAQIWSFFLSFIVIGYYWFAHHKLLSMAARVRTQTIVINTLYLALIAFLPFPTALIGQDSDASIAVALYAGTLALASCFETVLFRTALRHGDVRIPVSPQQRWQWTMASSVPVVVFALSIPIAFYDTSLAMFSWLLIIPGSRLADRVGPRRSS